MKNEVYINEQVLSLTLSKGVISKIFGEEKDGDFCNELNFSIAAILQGKEDEFYKNNKPVIDSKIDGLLNAVKEATQPYREHLNKYFLSEHLNFFLSNGCSIYAGSNAINQCSDDYAVILDSIRPRDFPGTIKEKIKAVKNYRPEQILDHLVQIQSYIANIEKNERHERKLNELILEVKRKFLESCILPIDYSNNRHHKTLLKKIISRPSSLNKVNIFTLNYDLLLEKSAEEIEIFVNNGFVGFHERTFLPSAFKLNLFLKETTASKPYSRILNLYKLHGSITWRFVKDKHSNPYGLEEVQIASKKIMNPSDIADCIIYPIQNKKRHALDLPYSELMRQFIENLHKPNSALFVMGYSFLDGHINDLILNALLNPDFHLIVFSYQGIDELSQEQQFLKKLIERSKQDSRITIFTGSLLGSFENIVTFLIPYVEEKDYQQIILETVKEIRDGIKSK